MNSANRHITENMAIPTENNWGSLTSKRGDELELHYSKTLAVLSRQKGVLGQIFVQSQNKIKEPAMLYKIIDMIDKEQWATLGADIKGTIYEGLLEKNAEDTKSGAGQYFTPRDLTRAMVECVQSEPMITIADPASGTSGFFLAAYDFIAKKKLDKTQKHFLKHETFFGNEIVPNTRRMCLMNLFLHNIGDFESENFTPPADALISDSGLRVDYVLANPSFGRKSSMTATNEEREQETDELTYNRQTFWETSSNKQLNFVQHIRTMLKSKEQAAVVLPDNVLFEGGAGETVREN
jgi:type I restriction enzyme M protein